MPGGVFEAEPLVTSNEDGGSFSLDDHYECKELQPMGDLLPKKRTHQQTDTV